MRVKLAAPSFSGVRQADAADPVQSVRHLVSSPEQGARNDHTTPLVVRRRRACRHCDRHDLCTIHVLGWDGGRDRCRSRLPYGSYSHCRWASIASDARHASDRSNYRVRSVIELRVPAARFSNVEISTWARPNTRVKLRAPSYSGCHPFVESFSSHRSLRAFR